MKIRRLAFDQARRVCSSTEGALRVIGQFVWPAGPRCPACGAQGRSVYVENAGVLPVRYECKKCETAFTLLDAAAIKPTPRMGLNVWAIGYLIRHNRLTGLEARKPSVLRPYRRAAWLLNPFIRAGLELKRKTRRVIKRGKDGQWELRGPVSAVDRYGDLALSSGTKKSVHLWEAQAVLQHELNGGGPNAPADPVVLWKIEEGEKQAPLSVAVGVKRWQKDATIEEILEFYRFYAKQRRGLAPHLPPSGKVRMKTEGEYRVITLPTAGYSEKQLRKLLGRMLPSTPGRQRIRLDKLPMRLALKNERDRLREKQVPESEMINKLRKFLAANPQLVPASSKLRVKLVKWSNLIRQGARSAKTSGDLHLDESIAQAVRDALKHIPA